MKTGLICQFRNDATVASLLHPLFGRFSLVKQRFVALLHRFRHAEGGRKDV
jgi:hypothetical protein